MSRHESTSELVRLLAPLQPLADRLYRFLPWWIGLLVVGWLVSGVTIVRAHEVALVMRFGALVNAGTAQAVREPGLLIAPPKPIGGVIRVPVRKVYEVELRTLHVPVGGYAGSSSVGAGLDPRAVGYALTGDRNLLHAAMVARYQIADPVAYTFGIEDPERLLGVVVVDEMGRAIGSRAVDAVLTDARADLVDAVMVDAQARLDALDAGLSLVSLELTDLTPPAQVTDDFAAVQSAAIDAETLVQQAREYEASVVPAARGVRGSLSHDAQADAAAVLADARGGADAFRSLALEVRKNPVVVRERLYREGVEQPLKRAGVVRFIPPPAGARYDGFRVSVR